jgi:hypothetical protein
MKLNYCNKLPISDKLIPSIKVFRILFVFKVMPIGTQSVFAAFLKSPQTKVIIFYFPNLQSTKMLQSGGRGGLASAFRLRRLSIHYKPQAKMAIQTIRPLQHSNTPTLQHSNTPTFQHSNIITLLIFLSLSICTII